MSASGKRLVIGIAIILLGAYALLSVLDVSAASDRLRLDREDLAEIKQKISEIEAASDAPRVAALDIESPDEIVNRINEALKKAGLSPSMLANQTPKEPQRIGKTDFTIRTVDIKLQAATIPQIVAFCEALRDEATGSLVRDLSLYEPRQNGKRETWLSQLVLTQVIFSPKSES